MLSAAYEMFNTSKTVAKLVKRDLRARIGAHSEALLGHNYHAEMALAKLGGMSNYEVLDMATSAPAQMLGLWTSIGLLAPGPFPGSVGVSSLTVCLQLKAVPYISLNQASL